MKRLPHLFFAAIALALSWPALGSALDFTPIEVRTVEDGMPLRRFAFYEGKTPIFFQAPKAWKMFGGGEEITFYPPASLDGDVRLGNSRLDPSIRFDVQGLAAYRTAAHHQLPKQAENIEVLSEATDAYPLDDWQSFEMWFSYNLRGTKKVRWVLFITMNPHRQVRLVVDSSQKHFHEVHTAARALLGSWFEPPAGWPAAAALKAP